MGENRAQAFVMIKPDANVIWLDGMRLAELYWEMQRNPPKITVLKDEDSAHSRAVQQGAQNAPPTEGQE